MPPGSNGDERRSVFGLRRGQARSEVRELKQRIGELERTIADLRRRKDLADLDEVELTEVASQTAVAMVRAAKQRQDEAARFTDVRALLDRSLTKLSAPTERAEQVVSELDQEDERLRAIAPTPSEQPQAQADEAQDVSSEGEVVRVFSPNEARDAPAAERSDESSLDEGRAESQ